MRRSSHRADRNAKGRRRWSQAVSCFSFWIERTLTSTKQRKKEWGDIGSDPQLSNRVPKCMLLSPCFRAGDNYTGAPYYFKKKREENMRLHLLCAALMVGCGGAAETVTATAPLEDASVSDSTVETAEGSFTPTPDASAVVDATVEDAPTDMGDDEGEGDTEHDGSCEGGHHHHHHHPGQVWHLHENRR